MWSHGGFVFYKNGKLQPPLVYSTGKTQADVFNELKQELSRYDVALLESQPGTGKTIVLLNLAREYGGAIFAAVTNVLSGQYVHDYEEAVPGVSIGFIMGRNNFECRFKEGLTCSCTDLPCRRPLEDGETRRDAGAVCPYFVYFSGEELREDEKYSEIYPYAKTYPAIGSRFGVINYQDEVCPFYRQFFAYSDKDVVALNFQMLRLEALSGRLVKKRLIVIDEADAFLESLMLKTSFTRRRISQLEREGLSIADQVSEAKNRRIQAIWDSILSLYEDVLELDGFFSVTASPIADFLGMLLKYLKAVDTDRCRNLLSKLQWLMEFDNAVAYVEEYETLRGTSKRMTLCVPEPRVVLMELFNRLGVGEHAKVVLCSATFQSREVLEGLYGIRHYGRVVGERRAHGKVIPCVSLRDLVVIRHSNWERDGFREHYNACFMRLLNRLDRPGVVLLHTYKYLPDDVDVSDDQDVERFKRGEIDLIVSAKIQRGVDFPNARGLLFQRYPYPDMQSAEIQVLRHTLSRRMFMSFYRDKARRMFVQGIGRCTRHPDQVVRVYSPDMRCFEELKKLGDIFNIEWEGGF